MTDAAWETWPADWRRMEEVARRRGWDVTPVSIAPPAGEGAIRRAEAAAGLPMPPQLRDVLTRHSASVRFEWHVPPHLCPMERQGFPTSSFNRGFAWDLDQMVAHAIPNFLALKRDLADAEESEAPNTPDMWERQFPIFWLANGDILTIDMRDPDGPQPVRYVSHELEVLHGQALAPDFLTFVSQMAALGQAGTEWASWMRFGEWDEDRFHLRADGEGGQEWRAWQDTDPAVAGADEPPPVILGETDAERIFLLAARNGDLAGLTTALAAGARPDVVWNGAWYDNAPSGEDEFATALTFAIGCNDTAMAERLLATGATLNTRRLPVAEAVSRSSWTTLEWLLERGARVDGWRDERYWPLHILVTRRSRLIAESDAELEARQREDDKLWEADADAETIALMREAIAGVRARERAARLGRAEYLAMLEALLAAGAAPDAPWDNGTTMLMWADAEAARILIRHRADPNWRTPDGQTPLHYASSPELVRVLVEAGADIDALASPGERRTETSSVYTPLQVSLMLGGLRGVDLARTLLELGADPHKRDGDGFPTIAYASSVPAFELIEPYGADPLERMPDGGTLLHRLHRQRGSIRASFPRDVAILDLLLSRGIDINAQDHAGRTILHLAAPDAVDAASIALLLERGADRTLRDAKGKRAIDLVPRSRMDLRAALK